MREKFLDATEAELELLAATSRRRNYLNPRSNIGAELDLALRRLAFKKPIVLLGDAIEMTEAGAGRRSGRRDRS